MSAELSNWSGKRYLKLFVFALLLANLTGYCVSTLARRQVLSNAASRHNKVYLSFLQAVERARKNSPTAAAPADGTAAADPAAAAVSPYWLALRDVRREFPYHRMDIVLQGTADGDRDRKVMESLKGRPRDWMTTDEEDGWARSFYVLPTRNTAAFQVVSDVRDEFGGWETTSIVIGGYAFVLLFAFGWFWAREVAEAQKEMQYYRRASDRAQVKETVTGIHDTADEMGAVIKELQADIAALERRPAPVRTEVVEEIEEIASQIRMLALNGSIEAARSSEAYRVFHVLMQEINHLATHSRELLKELDPNSAAPGSSSAEDCQPSPASGVSVRRVG